MASSQKLKIFPMRYAPCPMPHAPCPMFPHLAPLAGRATYQLARSQEPLARWQEPSFAGKTFSSSKQDKAFTEECGNLKE